MNPDQEPYVVTAVVMRECLRIGMALMFDDIRQNPGLYDGITRDELKRRADLLASVEWPTLQPMLVKLGDLDV